MLSFRCRLLLACLLAWAVPLQVLAAAFPSRCAFSDGLVHSHSDAIEAMVTSHELDAPDTSGVIASDAERDVAAPAAMPPCHAMQADADALTHGDPVAGAGDHGASHCPACAGACPGAWPGAVLALFAPETGALRMRLRVQAHAAPVLDGLERPPRAVHA